MKLSEVKQEYQLQVWSGMIQEQKASGLGVKNWYMENGVSENTDVKDTASGFSVLDIWLHGH